MKRSDISRTYRGFYMLLRRILLGLFMLGAGYAPLVVADSAKESQSEYANKNLYSSIIATTVGHLVQEIAAPALAQMFPGLGLYARAIVAGAFYPLAMRLTGRPGSGTFYVLGTVQKALGDGVPIKFALLPSSNSVPIEALVGVGLLASAATEKLCQLITAACLKCRSAIARDTAKKELIVVLI